MDCIPCSKSTFCCFEYVFNSNLFCSSPLSLCFESIYNIQLAIHSVLFFVPFAMSTSDGHRTPRLEARECIVCSP